MGVEMENLKAKMTDYFGKPVAEQTVKKEPMFELPEMISTVVVGKYINKVVNKLIARVEKKDLSPDVAQAVLILAEALSSTVPELGDD